MLDSTLTVKQHVIKVCHTACYELKHISSVRSYLTKDAAKKLGAFCALSRLLQFASHARSSLCYLTNAKSLELRRTFCSQSTAPQTLHISPTATSLAPDF